MPLGKSDAYKEKSLGQFFFQQRRRTFESTLEAILTKIEVNNYFSDRDSTIPIIIGEITKMIDLKLTAETEVFNTYMISTLLSNETLPNEVRVFLNNRKSIIESFDSSNKLRNHLLSMTSLRVDTQKMSTHDLFHRYVFESSCELADMGKLKRMIRDLVLSTKSEMNTTKKILMGVSRKLADGVNRPTTFYSRMSDENTRLKTEISSLKSQLSIEKLSKTKIERELSFADLDKLLQNNSSNKDSPSKSRNEIKNLSSQIMDLEDERDTLKEHIKILEERLTVVENERTELYKSNTLLMRELKSFSDSERTETSRMSELQKHFIDMNMKNKTQRDQIAKLQLEVYKLTEERNNLSRDLKYARSDLTTKTNDLNMQTELSEVLKRDLEKTRVTEEHLLSTIKQLTDKQTLYIDQLNSANTTISELHQVMENTRSSCLRASELESSIHEKDSNIDLTLRELKHSNDVINKLRAEKDRSNNSLRIAIENTSSLQQNIDELTNTVQTKTQKINRLKDKLKILQRNFKLTYDQLSQELKMYKKAKEDIETEYLKFKVEKIFDGENNGDAINRNQAKDKYTSDLRQDLSIARTEVLKLKNEINQLNVKFENYKSASEGKIQQLKDEKKVIEDKLESTETLRTKSEELVKETMQRYSLDIEGLSKKLETERTAYKNHLDSLTADKKNLEGENTRIKEKNSQLIDMFHECSKTMFNEIKPLSEFQKCVSAFVQVMSKGRESSWESQLGDGVFSKQNNLRSELDNQLIEKSAQLSDSLSAEQKRRREAEHHVDDMRAEINELMVRISFHERQDSENEKVISDLRRELSKAELELARAEQREIETEEILRTNAFELEHAQRTAKNYQIEKKEVLSTHEAYENETAALSLEIMALNEEIRRKTEDVEAAVNEKDIYEAELIAIQDKYDNLVKSTSRLQAKYEQLSSDLISQNQIQLEVAEEECDSDRSKYVAADNSRLKTENEVLKGNVIKLEMNVSELQQLNSKMGAEISRIFDILRSRGPMDSLISEVNSDYIAMSKDVAWLTKLVSTDVNLGTEYAAQIAKISSENTKLDKKAQRVKSLMDKHQFNLEDEIWCNNCSPNSYVTTNNTESPAKRRKGGGIVSSIYQVQLDNTKYKLNEANFEVEDLKEKLERMSNDLANTKYTLDTTEQMLGDITREKGLVEKKLEEMSVLFDSTRAEIDVTSRELELKSRENIMLKNEIADLKAELRRSSRKFGGQCALSETNKSSMDQANRGINMSRDALSQLEFEVSSLKMQLNIMKSDYENCQRSKQECIDKLSESNKKVHKLQEFLGTSEDKIDSTIDEFKNKHGKSVRLFLDQLANQGPKAMDYENAIRRAASETVVNFSSLPIYHARDEPIYILKSLVPISFLVEATQLICQISLIDIKKSSFTYPLEDEVKRRLIEAKEGFVTKQRRNNKAIEMLLEKSKHNGYFGEDLVEALDTIISKTELSIKEYYYKEFASLKSIHEKERDINNQTQERLNETIKTMYESMQKQTESSNKKVEDIKAQKEILAEQLRVKSEEISVLNRIKEELLLVLSKKPFNKEFLSEHLESEDSKIIEELQ